MKDFQSNENVRVYAVGGDGILFDCLNGIVGLPNVELAAVPYGASNDMIRAFGEDKKELFRNIKLQAVSPAILTDVIHCGNNYALNFCTVGIESDTIRNCQNMYNKVSFGIKRIKKLDAFVYSTLLYVSGAISVFNKKILNQYYKITIDGEDFSGVYGTINIANGPCYGGNKSPVITAMPNDGILDALFFQCMNSFKAACLIPPFTKGKFRRFPKYFTLKRLKKIEIFSNDPLLVDLDGEVFFDTSLTVEVIPAAVKIVAPGGISYKKRADPHG
jgi:diacylglycerol kinase family enzyme